MQFFIQLYIDIWRVIPYLRANPYCLKTKNINGLILLALWHRFFFRFGFFK